MEHKYLTMREAAEYVGPRRAGRPTLPETIRAWCLTGLRGVKLRSTLRGTWRVTTAGWVEEFLREVGQRAAALAAAEQQARREQIPPREQASARGTAAAREELGRLGLR